MEERETKQRYEQPEKHHYIIPLVTFFISMLFVFLIINQLRISDVQERQTHAKNLVEAVSHDVQSILKEYFNVSVFWSNYVAQNDGTVRNFSALAEAQHSANKLLNNIQLAPNGVVTYSYPHIETNVARVNLFTDPIHRDDAKYSRLTRLPTVTGPFNLLAGGKGLAIRTPIYIVNEARISEFWGFVTVTINVPAFFTEARLSSLEVANYDYQLKAVNPNKTKQETIAASTERTIADPITHTFDIYNTSWTFYVAPKGGWTNKSSLVLELLIGFLVSLLVAFCANSLAALIRREDTFKQLSYIDMLTKLYNSRKFYETLNGLQRKNRAFAVVYLDLNELKPINDMYGHKSGDDLLAIVAKKMIKCVREGDGVFRIGGDEFAIIVPNQISLNGLANLTQRLKASIGRETQLESASVTVEASVGYARCPEDAVTYEEAILRAEEMMFADKKAQKAGK